MTFEGLFYALCLEQRWYRDVIVFLILSCISHRLELWLRDALASLLSCMLWRHTQYDTISTSVSVWCMFCTDTLSCLGPSINILACAHVLCTPKKNCIVHCVVKLQKKSTIALQNQHRTQNVLRAWTRKATRAWNKSLWYFTTNLSKFSLPLTAKNTSIVQKFITNTFLCF